MSDHDLPPEIVSTALPQIHAAVATGDPTALAAIKEWGFASIARIYDPDPIFRPHHYLLKHRAEAEWRRMLAEHERRLKQILLAKSEEAWSAELNERILDRQHQGTERRRRDIESWNRDQRTIEYMDTRSFDTDERIREAQALAGIYGQVAPPPPPPDPWDEVRRIQAEMSRIAQDPTMTSAEKHRQTVPLQQALAQALARLGQ